MTDLKFPTVTTPGQTGKHMVLRVFSATVFIILIYILAGGGFFIGPNPALFWPMALVGLLGISVWPWCGSLRHTARSFRQLLLILAVIGVIAFGFLWLWIRNGVSV